MKNYILTIIFFGLMVLLGFEVYERFTDTGAPEPDPHSNQETVSATTALSYPDEITIIKSDGSELDVRLIARTKTHIQFERLLDEELFAFEINQLDPSSRAMVEKYPDTGLKDPGALFRSGQVDFESIYLEQLREAISKIDQEIKKINMIESISNSIQERRTLKNKVEKLKRDRQELERKVVERTGA